jgi:hypothetical protein
MTPEEKSKLDFRIIVIVAIFVTVHDAVMKHLLK